MDEMMEVMERNDKEELNSFSQYYIPGHAFRYINFGVNPRGIFGASPYDVLHGMKLGIIQYILEIFLSDELNEAMRHNLDQALKETLPYLKQGGNSQFPRLYFPNGITSVKRITGEESLGMLFVNYILSVTGQGREAVLCEVEKFSAARYNVFKSVFEKILLFMAWMTKPEGYWMLGNQTRGRNRATTSIKSMMEFICENFSRKSNQDWNISKMHELLHITHFIDQYGSPTNYDAGPGERMHKDFAKKPGRRSQKRHATFTVQAANRLADQFVLDYAYDQLVAQDDKDNNESKPSSHCSGSSFSIRVHGNADHNNFNVSIHGHGALSSEDLAAQLYPDLIQYIVAFFSEYPQMPTTILCCTEYVDDAKHIYRAHHSYRSTGFWHDWAWVSYLREGPNEGFTNVPAKILCFLPHGLPGDSRCHVVCHPCQWRSLNVTPIVRQWTLVPCDAATTNNIPYDIVPAVALFGHCFVVPDLRESGTVYQIVDKSEWADKFCAN
jgi:hypothetical protein